MIPIHAREPLVKVFHHEGQHMEAILQGLNTEDLARGYVAVVLNSNFARTLPSHDLSEDKPQALAPYLSYGETLRLVAAKLRSSWSRLTG